MKKFKFKDGSIITASTVDEAKVKHKVMADRAFYKFKKPLSEMLKENKDLTIKLSSRSHGEVCPNCEAIVEEDNLKFYSSSNHGFAFCHHKCPHCKCEWEANFKLTPAYIDNIIINTGKEKLRKNFNCGVIKCLQHT